MATKKTPDIKKPPKPQPTTAMVQRRILMQLDMVLDHTSLPGYGTSKDRLDALEKVTNILCTLDGLSVS